MVGWGVESLGVPFPSPLLGTHGPVVWMGVHPLRGGDGVMAMVYVEYPICGRFWW